MRELREDFKVSVVIPIFNEEGNVALLTERLMTTLTGVPRYELIFVDDGSTDQTLRAIRDQQAVSPNVHFLSFSRNFGHQNALRAGLDFASGDCAISMDGDLQHPPELLPEMIMRWKDGYDVVYTVRADDPRVPYLKRATARLFYAVINRASDVAIQPGAADFRLLDQRVVGVLRELKEADIFLRGMVSWLGFRQFALPYQPESRQWGETKYSLRKMLRLALAGITGFSVRPLHISTILGNIIAMGAFSYGLYAVYIRLFTDRAISGWASVLAAVLFVGGMQMIMLGILGEYLGKLFIQSKNRPNYIIREKSL